jgi:hypothetical protein
MKPPVLMRVEVAPRLCGEWLALVHRPVESPTTPRRLLPEAMTNHPAPPQAWMLALSSERHICIWPVCRHSHPANDIFDHNSDIEKKST